MVISEVVVEVVEVEEDQVLEVVEVNNCKKSPAQITVADETENRWTRWLPNTELWTASSSIRYDERP